MPISLEVPKQPIIQKCILRLVLGLISLSIVLFHPLPAYAGCPGNSRQQSITTANSQSTPAPDPDLIATPQPTPTPKPGVVQRIVNHTISFSSSSLMEAITEAFVELGRKSMDGALDKVLPAMDGSMAWMTEVDASGLTKFPEFESALRGGWDAMLKASLVIAPLVMALNVLAILGGGGGAVQARAELITRGLEGLLSYAGAASSYYLISLGVRASWGLTAYVWGVDFGMQVEPAGVMLGAVISTIGAALLSMTMPLFAIYFLFFLVFVVLALLGALGVALAAVTALLALATIVAPLMAALGSIPQFRWLSWTWTRLLLGLLLLPILNAILLKVGAVMQVTMLGAMGGGELGSALMSFFVVAGSLSLIIGINFKVGQGVFAPLAAVHRKALNATKSVAVLAAAGAGVAMGGPGVLKAGMGLGGGLGGGPTTGVGGALGNLPAANPGNGLGNAGGSARTGTASLPPRLAATTLSTLAGMSGNPLVRGALGAAADGFREAARLNGGAIGSGTALMLRGIGGSEVYQVSTQDAARAILKGSDSAGAEDRLAREPGFQSALRKARQHAQGLERAGIPLGDQVRQTGFSDPASYLSGLAYQVGQGDLQSSLSALYPSPDGWSLSNVKAPSYKAQGLMRNMGERLDALGEGGFPGREGGMQLLKQSGWWSFNPSTQDPDFSRYAQAFLNAAKYLHEQGEPGQLGALEGVVQRSRGYPGGKLSAEEHMSRIQNEILAGDFGEHQAALAGFFEPLRRKR